MYQAVVNGGLLSAVLTVFILAILLRNPRLMLQDYPEDVQRAVPPKTPREKKTMLPLGILFMVILIGVPAASTLALKRALGPEFTLWTGIVHAFIILSIFNLIDLIVLDWLLFCTLTPSFIVIPGTEGMPGYKNMRMHLRGFAVGTLLSAGAAVVIGLGVTLL